MQASTSVRRCIKAFLYDKSLLSSLSSITKVYLAVTKLSPRSSLLWIWFNYLKGGSQNQHLSQSGDEYKDILGEITQVIDNSRYRATFNVSILGDRHWIVESDQKLRSW